MSSIRKYLRSNPNAICDTCGRKRKWSEVQLSYGTGDVALVVSCIDGCADYRHPLNSPPPIIYDAQPIPNARPDISVANDFNFAQPTILPSYMSWFNLKGAGTWYYFNNPNTVFNMNGQWTWFNFEKP